MEIKKKREYQVNPRIPDQLNTSFSDPKTVFHWSIAQNPAQKRFQQQDWFYLAVITWPVLTQLVVPRQS